MATYLLRFDDDYSIHEADSAKQAVEQVVPGVRGSVLVWTLRSTAPRKFEVETETLRTVKQT